MHPPRPASWYADHAGYSYPTGASPAQIEHARRANGARLRLAAKIARDLYHAHAYWDYDYDTPHEEHWPLWQCDLWHKGRVVACLGGIDFGPDAEPHDGSETGDYALIVEAELALEAFLDS